MRRPMVFAAAAFGSGIGAAFFVKAGVCFWAVPVTGLLACFLWSLTRKGQDSWAKRCCLFLCLFLAGGLHLCLFQAQSDPLVKMEGEHVQVRGLVQNISREETGYKLMVRTENSLVLTRYYGAEDGMEELTGRNILCSGTVSLPAGRRNPGCFDYRLYLRSRGIQALITADSIERIEGRESAFLKLTAYIRGNFQRKLETCMDADTRAMTTAMLFGDKTALDQELYEAFQKNGTAHILAVSGLHIGILYGFFAFLWRGKRGSLFHVCAAVLLLFYTALADFSPSVVRAAVMIALHLLSVILCRRYDLLSAAGFTFLLMLLDNPFQLFHTGFQMSFLAVASLGVILPFVRRFYQGIFLSSLVIQAGMLPYTAYMFNYISLGAFFANLPVIFLAGLLLPAGISLIPLSFVSDPLFEAGAELLQLGCELLIRINQLFYAGGSASFDAVSPPIWLLAGYYGLLFWCASEKGRILLMRKKRTLFWGGAAALVAAGLCLAPLTDQGFSKAAVVFVDVGQGDCIHVRTPRGHNYLFDGGGSVRYDVGRNILKPYLLKNGVKKIDAAFVTHLHEDHYGGIRSLAREGMIERIGVYEANRVIEKQIRKETGTELFFLYKGQTVWLDKDVKLEILAPERRSPEEYERMIEEEEDENASSLIMKLEYQGMSVLITGDIDAQGEGELVEESGEKLRSHILKVAHHGSKYSSSEEFLEAVDPALAVFQVGKNNFGHPSEAVIEKCGQKGIMIVRNDTSGAVGIRLKPSGRRGQKRISVQKMIE